ncbi:MAG: hypothetical protein AB1500_04690 [Bacillota bacterium]
MSKRTSRLLLASLTLIMLISVLVTSAYAGEAWVYISQGEGPQLSASISGTDVGYEGWNYDTSGHRFWISLQGCCAYGNWWTLEDYLINIDDYYYSTYSIQETSGYRVQLNPELWFTDCDGKGVVRNL